MRLPKVILLSLSLAACAGDASRDQSQDGSGGGASGAYDLVITNGRVVDGTGSAWFHGDVAIRDGRIARITHVGALAGATATRRIDAKGLVVAPGFIDIQGQSYENFMTGDGKALSMITQGITTAILGEGSTPAPSNEKVMSLVTDTAMKRIMPQFVGEHGFGAWLEFMVQRGVSQNVGSFVGAGTVRTYAKGETMGAASAAELDTMKTMVERAMRDGAFGVASALIYPPNSYASTEELIHAAKASAPFGGLYITHMRSEGNDFLEALDEAIRIGREGGVPVEVYHLKASGPRNWSKMPRAIAKIDSARAAGQDVQADMYLYPAGGNSFAACIPPKYAAEGKLLENLRNPALRASIKSELKDEKGGYENLCLIAGPENVMVVGFKKPEYLAYEGKRLSEIATAMKKDWADVMIDLNVAEEAELGEILFLMSEENIKLQLRQPWMKFGTDAGAADPDSAKGMVHPRTYGNFPRLFGKYVREEKVLTLEDAVRKSTSAVATRLSIDDRGVLKQGLRADIVIFDPDRITDRATFDKPHQLSEGVQFVFVNGVEVLSDGKHTGAKPGMVVRGTGWSGQR